jgi:hypothetical protein
LGFKVVGVPEKVGRKLYRWTVIYKDFLKKKVNSNNFRFKVQNLRNKEINLVFYLEL